MRKIIKENIIRSCLILAAVIGLLLTVSAAAWAADLQPDIKDGKYQIGTAEELVWFSALVNGELTDGTKQDSHAQAVLTDDIDMTGVEYTPVGYDYSHLFEGNFDGNHHVVSGLAIDSKNANAGLFGAVKNADIRNVILQGDIRGENIAVGGIVGISYGKTSIASCGNEASVTNTRSSGSAAGIVAVAQDPINISDSYNRGSISAVERASGIGANMTVMSQVTRCYNTGQITGQKASGIGNVSSCSYTDCYNAGEISGSASAYAISSSASSEYKNCFYIRGQQVDDTEQMATAISENSMKKSDFVTSLGEDKWQKDKGAAVNGGFPLLAWEKAADVEDSEPADDPKAGVDDDNSLAAPKNLLWNESSKVAVWDCVPGADSYIVTLYCDNKKQTEFTITQDMLSSEDNKAKMYFQSCIMAEGSYYFTVQARKGEQASKTVSSESSHFDADRGETVKISSVQEWIALVNISCKGTDYQSDADRQNIEWSRNYELAADLDFSGVVTDDANMVRTWGNIDAMFNGNFDGKGHKITGLTLSGGEQGLFQYIGPTGHVKNLTIENTNAQFSDNAGIMAYYNYGSMENIAVVNANITADQGSIIGGMISRNFGSIRNCYVQGGKLTARSSTANGQSGFVGNNFGSIRNCYSSMDVDVKSYCAGGFAGWSDDLGDYAGSFENCMALGDVSAKKGWSGGFIGRVNSTKVTFDNCYAANRVTSSDKPERAYGFAGSMSGEAAADIIGSTAFSEDIPASNFRNCYYAMDLTARDNPKNVSRGLTLENMKTAGFAASLGQAWTRSDNLNNGLPYLSEIPAPAKIRTENITVKLAIAIYDTDRYEFVSEGSKKIITVNMTSSGNTRVIDVMAKAQEDGLLQYEYKITPAYGSFIESINGHKLESPDGWMFTVNDELSNVSATLASVEDGDSILWYEGRTSNLFQAPSWQEITGEAAAREVKKINNAEELAALCGNNADMTASYKLTADIDMSGANFQGIGSRDKPFSGSFDGAGHTISNLRIDRPEEHNVGMFNFIRGAKLQNINLKNAYVRGEYSVGSLVGVAAVLISKESSAKHVGNTIGNCKVSGQVISANDDKSGASKGSYAGGLIGFNDGDEDSRTGMSILSSVDKCKADVSVHGGAIYTGGLAGGNFGYITGSRASGNVEGAECAGGFVGGNDGGIYDCSAEGDVSGLGNTGGFAGNNYGTASGCFSVGDVHGNGAKIGGFAGSASGAVRKCASAGKVTYEKDSSYIGGLIGHYSGTLTGLKKDITFEEAYGWCGSNGELNALGNKTTSTVEAEEEVIRASQITDWKVLQDKFSELFQVTLSDEGKIQWPAEKDTSVQNLTDSIYNKLLNDYAVNGQTSWIISDLASYDYLAYGEIRGLSDKEIKSYVNYIAREADSLSAGDLAKSVIAFHSIGLDPTSIRCESGKTIDLVEMLKSCKSDSIDVYAAPYVFMALSQRENYMSADERDQWIARLAGLQRQDGSWGSADVTGPYLMALAMWKDQSPIADEAISKALKADAILAYMDENGAASYNGNASCESTALLIAGIESAGGNAADYIKNGNTLVDGLLTFVNKEGNGFIHDRSGSGDPAISTEQGFRGLMSVVLSEKNRGGLYDFRKIETVGASADDMVHATKIIKAKRKSSRSIYVEWKPISGADGYEIRYSRKSSFSKKYTRTVTVKGEANRARTLKKLSKKKKYYFKVRTYRVINDKKCYSVWSARKSVR